MNNQDWCKYRRSHQRCSVKKKVLLEISQNSQENTCARVSFLIKLQALGLQLYLKETLAQMVVSCEFCKISKNNFSSEHLGMTASANKKS